jgi:hypothetical protein
MPGGIRWLPSGLRVASHTVVWAMVLVPAGIELGDGWRPTRDDAMISIGSYQVFSMHSPLVGVWSQASQGMRHAFFGLGPLPFWLLSVPVRLDPSQGVLWGAALVSGCALSVAVEAAWSVRGWPAGLAVALVTADLGWATQMFGHLVWNPYLGLVFLVAATATSWAVAAGRFGWWPVAIVFASVSAQCHLVYAVPAAALVLAAPVTALACGHRPSRRRWLVVGLVAAAVSWAPTLLQEAFAHPGNLTLIVNSGVAQPAVGFGLGLHALATATTPFPIWLTRFPFLVALGDQMTHYLDGHPLIWGVAAVGLLAVVAGWAGRTRRRNLSALAVIALVLSAGTVVSIAAFPKDQLGPVGYLSGILWVVGMVVWLVVAWAVVDFGTDALRRLPVTGVNGGGRAHLRTGLEAAGLLLLVVGVAAALQVGVDAAPQQVAAQRVDAPLDRSIARSVEQSVPSGPVVLVVRPSAFVLPDPAAAGTSLRYYVIDYWGAAIVLLGDGWQPGLPDGLSGKATHLSVPDGARWPEVVIRVDPSDLRVTGVRRLAPPSTPP